MEVFVPMGKVFRINGEERKEFFGWKKMNIFVRKYLPAYQMLTDFEIIESDGTVRQGNPFDFFVVKDSEVFLLKLDMIDVFRINP